MPEPGRETGPFGPFLDQAVAALAERQHAVFRLEHLLVLGLSASAVRKRRRRGRLHRRYQGVYSLVPPPLLSLKGQWLAAVFACGEDAALSHRSAAALHGLRATSRTKIDVTVPARSARTHRGIDLHRSSSLTPADVTIVDGIPCTTVARTLFDMADVLPRRAVERAFDQAEIERILDIRAVEDQLARNPTRRAAKVIRAILAEHYIGSTVTFSALEELFVPVWRDTGLPAPEVNELLVLPDGGPPIRVDFLFRSARVAVETDGYETHRTRQQFEIDRENDQRLAVHNWIPFRPTWRQVKRRPEVVKQRLMQLASRPGAAGPA